MTKHIPCLKISISWGEHYQFNHVIDIQYKFEMLSTFGETVAVLANALAPMDVVYKLENPPSEKMKFLLMATDYCQHCLNSGGYREIQTFEVDSLPQELMDLVNPFLGENVPLLRIILATILVTSMSISSVGATWEIAEDENRLLNHLKGLFSYLQD